MASSIADRLIKVTMSTPSDVRFEGARIREGINRIAEAEIFLSSEDNSANLEKLIGDSISLDYEHDDEPSFHYEGICISVREFRRTENARHFSLLCKSWLWLLTRRRNCRVHAKTRLHDVIKAVTDEYAGSLSGTATPKAQVREKYVQYDETDFDFISRLMEEYGVSYLCADDKLKFSDFASPEDAGTLDFVNRTGKDFRPTYHVFGFERGSHLVQSAVTLHDFDFQKPSNPQANLFVSKKTVLTAETTAKNKAWPLEDYRHPGGFIKSSDGDQIIGSRINAVAHGEKESFALSNSSAFRAGRTFTLAKHPNSALNADYLIVDSELLIKGQSGFPESHFEAKFYEDDAQSVEWDLFRSSASVIPEPMEFAPLQKTARPRIYGIQTATVVGDGKSEGQIDSDQYGRVKIRFHWDREDNPEHHFWVRCVQPWTGKNWGMYAIPRIGQEVLIQFEHGDPDRPICVGMLYNDLFRPPYDLPQNQTQTGIVTRSVDGDASTFNELVFEDKKDAEFVRFQSEKDFTQIVKNNATITVGLEKKDPGDLITDVHNNIDIDAGTNIDVDAGQNITLTAKSQIKLVVGSNSITIDQSGVTIKATTVTVDGTASVDVSAPSTTVSGDISLTLKGGIVSIN